jgi:vancomycin resistance protein VanW
MSLIGGLKVIERYNHSVDIYSEESRFCPLGTDATIVYGYKDLRIQNTYAFPIKFQLEVQQDTLHVKLLSTFKLEENKLIINIENSENGRKVQLFNEDHQLLSTSNYKIIPELIS